MKKLMLMLPFFAFVSFAAAGQSEKNPLRKNAIYGNVGTSLFWAEATINAERLLAQNSRGTVAFGIQAGFGYCGAAWEDEGAFFNPKVVLLAGNEKQKFFELTAGANLYTNPDLYNYSMSNFVPAAALGYRRHFPAGGMLRCGIGWPTGAYIGLGLRF